MKNTLLILLLLASFTGHTQLRDLLRDPAFWVGNSAAMIGGAADGTNEVISHHYYKFEAVFPRANDQYWNPNLSWTNKYQNPFPGKTTLLVWTTDGYHMTRAVDNLFTITVMPMFTTPSAVDLFDKETPREVKWQHVKRRAIEGLSHYLFRQLAFTLVYDKVF